MTRPLLCFLYFTLSYCQLQAQCPRILTDDRIDVCESGGTTVDIQVEGTILTANWSPAIGLDDANILNPTFLVPLDTTYFLTITGIDPETQDTCEIQKVMDIKIAAFDLIIPQDTVKLACGDTIQLTADVAPNGSFFIIEWESVDGHFTSGNQTLTPFVDAVGQYNASVIGTLGRIVCRDKDSLQVVLKGEQLMIEPPEKLHCNQPSITLSVVNPINTDAYLYNWTTTTGQLGETNDQFEMTVEQSGLYEVTRTNLLGDCRTTAAVEVETVTPFEDFSLDLIEPTCGQQTGSIAITNLQGGQAPFQYAIDNDTIFQNVPVFEDLTEMNYLITVKDGNECKVSKAASFEPFTSFNLSLSNFQTVEKGSEFQFPLTIIENGVSIESVEWWPNVGLSCTDCPQPFLTDFKNRRYEVTVVDDTGCVQKVKIEIAIQQPNLFYTPTVFSPNNDGQNDVFSIFTNTKFVKQLNHLTIFDRYGNLIFQQSGLNGTAELAIWDGQYKGKEMPIGAYLYAGELELLDGEIERFTGTLNLIR